MVSTSDHGSVSNTDALFDRYEERLSRTVRLRLDRRLSGLVDCSGVLKLAREKASVRSHELAGSTPPNAFLWLRQITGEVLAELHQERFGQDIRGDISLYRGALPEATSISLAAHLLGRAGGADDEAAARAEQKLLLQEALNAMDALDREVLTLRHCEQLSNDETAAVVGISKSQASEAYIRALKRITVILASLPGFKGKTRS
ncbi:MAG TPA: sigma factor-like helix-turn-helix DNA-binding protein [Isosphaeraceae bacterium]|nr:sigma factor-like helix-turn-helix DNA-binding protein [Isosphaeraceae bacterium]